MAAEVDTKCACDLVCTNMMHTLCGNETDDEVFVCGFCFKKLCSVVPGQFNTLSAATPLTCDFVELLPVRDFGSLTTTAYFLFCSCYSVPDQTSVSKPIEFVYFKNSWKEVQDDDGTKKWLLWDSAAL